MATLVLDLETVPDSALWQPPADEPDAFPPPFAHAIVCVGVLALNRDLTPTRIDVLAPGGDERARLERFAAMTGRSPAPTLVTWNGRGFDLPVLEARSLRHGIPQPFLFARDTRDRYRGHQHVDVKDVLSNYGAAKGYHLDDIAHTIGLPGKVGTDGSMVATMVAAGRLADVEAYCLSDVWQTAAVWFRYQLVVGSMTPAGYATAMRGLLDVLDADTRLAPLAAAIDRRAIVGAAA